MYSVIMRYRPKNISLIYTGLIFHQWHDCKRFPPILIPRLDVGYLEAFSTEANPDGQSGSDGDEQIERLSLASH